MADWNRTFFNRCMVACILAAAAWVGPAFGGPFTAGNLVVVRVGDGSTALSTNAAAVSLLEYTRSGTLLQTISLASTGTSALTLVGTTTTEGILQGSSNGQYLLLAGYRKNAGQADPSVDASTTTNRVVGRVDLNANVDTSTALTDAYSSKSVRGASSDDGTRFWTSGEPTNPSGGLRYAGSLGATTSTLLGSYSNNLRQVSVLGGNLFTSSGTGTPGRSVFHVGSGLPTSGSPTFTSSFTPDPTSQYQSFYFTNLGSGNNWDSTGFDTLYTAGTNSNALFKYSFNGTSWVLNNTVSLAGIMDVTGSTQGTTVTLFVTTGTDLESFTDTAGYNANLNGTFTSLATAGSNYVFRGVAAVPEPGPLLLSGLTGLAMAVWGRRNRSRVST